MSQFATICRRIYHFCKPLITKTFISQKLLDTPVFRLIRFVQKVLTEFSPPLELFSLEEEAAHVAGRPLCFDSAKPIYHEAHLGCTEENSFVYFGPSWLKERINRLQALYCSMEPLGSSCVSFVERLGSRNDGRRGGIHVLRRMWNCSAPGPGILQPLR